jgi:hypothetical protein
MIIIIVTFKDLSVMWFSPVLIILRFDAMDFTYIIVLLAVGTEAMTWPQL